MCGFHALALDYLWGERVRSSSRPHSFRRNVLVRSAVCRTESWNCRLPSGRPVFSAVSVLYSEAGAMPHGDHNRIPNNILTTSCSCYSVHQYSYSYSIRIIVIKPCILVIIQESRTNDRQRQYKPALGLESPNGELELHTSFPPRGNV